MRIREGELSFGGETRFLGCDLRLSFLVFFNLDLFRDDDAGCFSLSFLQPHFRVGDEVVSR